jgi:hypothetical protein
LTVKKEAVAAAGGNSQTGFIKFKPGAIKRKSDGYSF